MAHLWANMGNLWGVVTFFWTIFFLAKFSSTFFLHIFEFWREKKIGEKKVPPPISYPDNKPAHITLTSTFGGETVT